MEGDGGGRRRKTRDEEEVFFFTFHFRKLAGRHHRPAGAPAGTAAGEPKYFIINISYLILLFSSNLRPGTALLGR